MTKNIDLHFITCRKRHPWRTVRRTLHLVHSERQSPVVVTYPYKEWRRKETNELCVHRKQINALRIGDTYVKSAASYYSGRYASVLRARIEYPLVVLIILRRWRRESNRWSQRLNVEMPENKPCVLVFNWWLLFSIERHDDTFTDQWYVLKIDWSSWKNAVFHFFYVGKPSSQPLL